MIALPWGPRLCRRGMLAALAVGTGLFARSGAIARANEVAERVSAMTPRERAARMFMFPITGTMLGARDEAWLRELKLGGVILVQANFGSSEEVAALVTAIHATNPDLPPLVALDQEGGVVSRIVDDPAPDAPTLGTLPLAEVSRLARLRAEALAAYGFDVNFAPVADVAFAPDSFMSGRTFGDDPERVAADVAAYLDGVRDTGVLHCVKHFPGHGRVSIDSHESLPALLVDEATWWQEDALPFRAAVDAGVPMVMLGHLAVPMWDDLPASLSPAAVAVLRHDLGFAGAVVSDDLGMGALSAWGALDVVDLAVAAGVDLLLYVIAPDDPAVLVDHLVAGIERGAIARERIDASVTRLLAMQLGRAIG